MPQVKDLSKRSQEAVARGIRKKNERKEEE